MKSNSNTMSVTLRNYFAAVATSYYSCCFSLRVLMYCCQATGSSGVRLSWYTKRQSVELCALPFCLFLGVGSVSLFAATEDAEQVEEQVDEVEVE